MGSIRPETADSWVKFYSLLTSDIVIFPKKKFFENFMLKKKTSNAHRIDSLDPRLTDATSELLLSVNVFLFSLSFHH